MKSSLAVFMVFSLAVLLVPPCAAQKPPGNPAPAGAAQESYLDNYIQALRSDVRADRMQIVTAAMRFTEAEAAVFWPVYRNYQAEVTKISDQKIALLKDYAQNFDTMSAAKARELADRSFAVEQQKTDLKRKYFKEFEKVLPANRVARFFQVDHRLDLLIDLQIAAQVPLMD